MKSVKFSKGLGLLLLLTSFVSSCTNEADPGPVQIENRDFAIIGFDRLDIGDFDRIVKGDKFNIAIQQGPVYSVHITGDRRNLSDLNVVKIGSRLRIGYLGDRQRTHTTYITITMPVLTHATLSSASNATINGFNNVENIDLILSGTSVGSLNIETKRSRIILTGQSKLAVTGKSDSVVVKAAEASELYAYALFANDVDAAATGSSKISINARNSLKATASDSSSIYYRGNPTVNSSVSAASTVKVE